MMIRAARSDEAARLTQLAFDSKRHWGYDEAFMELCRSELVVREGDVHRGNVFVVADESSDAPIGLYVLTTVSELEGELDMLFVDPSHIGGGVGAALLAHAKDLARERGLSVLRVEADPFAAAFYEHEGAVLIGTTRSVSTGRELPTFEFRL
jgi:GNAT superfamily N-acetyltransferase